MFFLMEMFFLSYVNETKYLLWNLPFLKMVPPNTKFWLTTAQQISIHISCFMAGDDTPHAILSQKCLLWERGLVKLPQPRGASLIRLIAF